ncbi:MAG: tyrosine-type recombinase/integrase [Firmicutes bacterium]|nr:tyrosine-type recombinase/integrase [Bacillota bacterium]
MKFECLLDDFVDYHRSLCHTEKTIRSYTEILTKFNNIVEIEDYQTISLDDVKLYQKSLNARNLSPATVGTYLRHIKAFIHWLENYDYIEKNGIWKKIKLPKAPKKNVKIYTNEEIKLIFNSVTTESQWLTYRNQLIIALMLDSGLRREEICKIRFTDINFEKRILNVHGKGKKDRLVPIGNLTLSLLDKYMSACPFESEMLFVGRRGEKVTDNTIKQTFHKLKGKLGFEFSPHRLRHNFATNYLIDYYEKYHYFDVYTLKIIMGHEDIETTDMYLHYAQEYIATQQRLSHLDKALLEIK